MLRDKVCLIVGAASLRGIGYATAELFARHGAKLAVVDVAMDESTTASIAASITAANGRRADPRWTEVRYPELRRVQPGGVARPSSGSAALDCLVNCAGIVRAQSMLSIAEADYDRILGVNLKGTFNICQAALSVFAERRSGTIVNLASVAAQRGGGLVGGAHYAASKGGVISLTRTIAREFGPLGIRANVVCPSMVETAMLDGNLTSEKFAEIVSGIPLQRAGKPSDIAGACLFLASDLSAYVTGATIDVNGGSHIH